MKFFISILLLLCCSYSAFGQFTITNGNNITISSILSELVGQGVIIQNIKMRVGGVDVATLSGATQNSARQMYGRYTYQATGTDAHNLTKGMIVSTGNVLNIPSPSAVFASTGKNFGGDATLSGTGYDAIALEFDIYPLGYELKFNYMFASEEYDDYVCSPFNDSFGFFVTRPKPNGGMYDKVNMAIIPNTPPNPTTGMLGTPVSINNVNSGGPQCNPPTLSVNPAYHDPMGSPHMVFDQRTKGLFVKFPVIPAQKYTLYLVVQDVRDAIFDTGVFIENVGSNAPILILPTPTNGLPEGQLYEGDQIQNFKVKRDVATLSETLKLRLKGTATQIDDYELYEGNNLLPSGDINVQFAIEETEKNYTLKIKSDNIAEVNETVILELLRPNASPAGDAILQAQTYTIINPLNVNRIYSEQIELYPNPAQNYVWLKTSLSIQAVELLDNAGKTLQQVTVNRSQAGQYELIIKELSKGQYKLKIWVGKEFIIKDLIKE